MVKICNIKQGLIIFLFADPMLWSTGDVKAWVMFTLQHYNLPMVPIENFTMDGAALVVLTEEEFNQRAPQVRIAINNNKLTLYEDRIYDPETD